MPQYYITPPPVSPLGRALTAILAVAVILGVVVFGFFVLALAAATGILLWIFFSIRGWWRRKKGVKKTAQEEGRKSETIEAEYTVISRRRD